MACGCTVASSNVGAIPEILEYEGEKAGICFAPQNADEVANAAKVLYDDDTYRMQLSEKAREKVYGSYTTEKIWPQLTDIWKHVISQEERT